MSVIQAGFIAIAVCIIALFYIIMDLFVYFVCMICDDINED